jgi:glycosyltransferase involved in cell wall biosynthesis
MGVQAKRNVGFWAWELEWLPRHWRHAFAFYDEVWAATRFAEDAFARDGLRPVTLVPMAVMAPRIEVERDRAALDLPADATVFLFMFDFRSFASRKNPEAVVHAFLEAFPTGDEKVYLLMKTSGAAAKPADWENLQAMADDPRIEIRDARLERDVLLNLVRQTDAFVSLHRSEGFGRGPAEAMLMGVPVIVTDYSGTADYATPDCALVVDHTLVPVDPGEYPGVEGQRWADANVATAARHMRWVHENRAAARALGERGRQRIGELYNTRAIGRHMLDVLGIDAAPVAAEDQEQRVADLALPA